MRRNEESNSIAPSRSMRHSRPHVNSCVVTSSSLLKGQFDIKESSPLSSLSCDRENSTHSLHRSSRWDSFKRFKQCRGKKHVRSLSISCHENPTPVASMFKKTNGIIASTQPLQNSSSTSLGKNFRAKTKTSWKPEDIVEKLPAVVEFDTCSSNTDETSELDTSPSHQTASNSRSVEGESRTMSNCTSKNAGNSRNSSVCQKSNKNSRRDSRVLEPISYHKPDVYGQVHPIETEELLNKSLEEFEKQLRLIPSDISGAALMAEEMCPEIVSRDFKICFLRAEVFRVSDAIRRYTKYWSKRIQLLGPTRAFKPITLSSLTESERRVVSSQFATILPSINTTCVDEDGNETSDPRCVLFIQFAYFEKATMCNEDIVRVMWYMIHSLMEDVNCQKRGFLYLQNAAKFHAIKNCPSIDFLRMCLSYVQECVPLRMSGCHVVNPNYLVKMVFPLVNLMLSERLRKRVLVHTDRSVVQTAAKLLNQFKFDQSRLPVSVGGTYEPDFQQWIQQRINDGK
jgi:CRAL/TRIO domain